MPGRTLEQKAVWTCRLAAMAATVAAFFFICGLDLTTGQAWVFGGPSSRVPQNSQKNASDNFGIEHGSAASRAKFVLGRTAVLPVKGKQRPVEVVEVMRKGAYHDVREGWYAEPVVR